VSKLREDIRRLSKHAALIGVVIAIVCHLLPPQYRVACDAIAKICRGEAP
jgi:hypothetical protein